MKILHVIPSVSLQHGGPSVVIRIMTEALARAGHDVHLATTDDDGSQRMPKSLGRPQSENGVYCWYFARTTRHYKMSGGLTIWLTNNVKRFDVVHIHALFSYAALPAAYAARQARVPYLVRPLGVLNQWGIANRRPALKRLSYRLIESHIVSHASLMHYTSKQERLEAEALGIRTPSVIIPNPVPFADAAGPARPDRFYDQHPEVRGKRIILFLSRFDAKKGLDLLLQAYSRMAAANPNSALVLAGSGDKQLEAALRAQARDLQIADRVVWTGFLEGLERWSAYRASDLFVLPSYSENFGVAAAEAMAAGLPVVVTDQVGLHPDVSDSGSGIVTRCDPAEIAHAMERLIRNPETARQMGRSAQMTANSRYSIPAVTSAIEKAYRTAMGREVETRVESPVCVS